DTVANVRADPFCQTRTVPDRSVQKRRPSGANASAVAKLALIVPCGCVCGPTLHADGFDEDFVAVGVDAEGDDELADGFGDPLEHAASRVRPSATTGSRFIAPNFTRSACERTRGGPNGPPRCSLARDQANVARSSSSRSIVCAAPSPIELA